MSRFYLYQRISVANVALWQCLLEWFIFCDTKKRSQKRMENDCWVESDEIKYQIHNFGWPMYQQKFKLDLRQWCFFYYYYFGWADF